MQIAAAVTAMVGMIVFPLWSTIATHAPLITAALNFN